MTQPRPGSVAGETVAQIVFAIVLLLLLIAEYAGNAWITALAVIVMDGGAAAAWIASATLLGVAILRIALIPLDSLFAWTTAAGLGIGIYSLAMLGLGLGGWVGRGSVLTMTALSAVAGGAALWRSKSLRLATLPVTNRWRWLLVGIVPFLAISLIGACLPPLMLWKPDDPHPYDVLVYHLQVPREWYELGRMVPLGHNVFSYFPFNSEMHDWAAMYLKGSPVEGIYAAQFMSVGFFALAILAVISGFRREGDRFGSLVGGLLFASVPWLVMLSCVAYVESLLILFTTLSIAWICRAIRESAASNFRSYALAGVFAGLAAGTKIIAVPMLIALLPAVILVVAIIRRRDRDVPISAAFRGCAIFAIASAMSVSPWLIRNMVWVGNPIYPIAMRTLGAGDFSAEQVERFEQAHSAPIAERSLSGRAIAFYKQAPGDWQYGYFLFPLAIAGAIQQRKRVETWICVLLIGGMIGIWMFATHLISRFFVIAIPPAIALVCGIEWKRFRPVGAVAVLIVAGGSFAMVHQKLSTTLRAVPSEIIGFLDLRQLLPEAVAPLVDHASGSVVLAGDSRAFAYPIPMSRLKYRLVFNLNFTGVDPNSPRQLLSAWAGVPIESLPPGSAIVVDPVEWDRLAKSYHIPPLPASLPGPRDQPFVLSPEQVPQ